MNVLVLHLSEVHISDASDPILERSSHLANSLRLIPHNVDSVILAFSGDIVFSGNAEEYNLTSKFIVDLSSKIQDVHPDSKIKYHPQSGWYDESPQRGLLSESL